MIACAAVAAWSEIAAIADAAEREEAQAMLRETLLFELRLNREPGTRRAAEPSAVLDLSRMKAIEKAIEAETLATEPSAVLDLSRMKAVEAATRAAEPSAVPELGRREDPDLARLADKISSRVLAEIIPELTGRLGGLQTSVSEIGTTVSEIAKVTGVVHDQLRRWTVSYEETSGTPRLFTLTPVSKRGLDKAAVWQDAYQITLWCEHADQPHPWQPAQYQFNKPKDWLITVAPYALGVLKVLRLAVKVTVPIATLADADLGSIKDDLDAMGKLLDQLPKKLFDSHAAPDQTQVTQADGPDLRALRALLTELDPNRTFNGMHVVAIPPADIRWVCQDHYAAYPPPLP